MAGLFGNGTGSRSSQDDILRILGLAQSPDTYRTPGIGDDILRHKQGMLGGGTNYGPAPLQAGEKQSGYRPALPDFSEGDLRHQLPDSTNQPRQPGQIDPRLMAMVGQAPQKKNNTGRDILSGALAAIGDAFSPNQRGKGAVDMVTKQWGDRRSAYDSAMSAYEDRKRIASLPGMNEREMAAYMADPKAWGSHMADAATSRYQAATLNPADQRYLGEGNGIYQAPTRGQLYAQSMGAMPGSEAWNSAIQDQELGSHGPTAFGQSKSMEAIKAANAARMESMRQQGRTSLEGVRQGNRMQTRSTPTYRDRNPVPPRPPALRNAPRKASRPTATGPNGQRIEWDGKAWVPAR